MSSAPAHSDELELSPTAHATPIVIVVDDDISVRESLELLIDNQGWTYKRATGRGYPRLYPADRSQSAIKVPKTGHTRGRAFDNWIAQVRRKGGHWPPERK